MINKNEREREKKKKVKIWRFYNADENFVIQQ